MNTVLFAAAKHAGTKGDFLKLIDPNHPAHPKWYDFADDVSMRNYERVLRGDPLSPTVSNPVVIVSRNGPGCGLGQMVRSIIRLKHGVKNPFRTKIYGSSKGKAIEAAILQTLEAGEKYIWFDDVEGKFVSRSMGLYSHLSEDRLTFYVSGNCLEVGGKELIARCRVIRLSAGAA